MAAVPAPAGDRNASRTNHLFFEALSGLSGEEPEWEEIKYEVGR